MPITTRLTERLGIAHPVLSAPMGLASGGALAAAVSAAGGLGLIGGGYGNEEFLTREFAAAGNQRVGCGFITWSMAKQPHLLDLALSHRPAALMLSFGDPAPFAPRIRDAGAMLICQVQSLAHARAALACGADVIVAEGSEAGGHSGMRGLFTLAAEVADLLRAEKSEIPLVAAGGVADGRGLAAALMLGADGVLMGSRFWASRESLAHPDQKARAVIASGDDTLRDPAADIVRGFLGWPSEFIVRVLKNEFSERWNGRTEELTQAAPSLRDAYWADFNAGNPDRVGLLCGEVAGLIHDIPSAREIVERTVAQAESLLSAGGNYVVRRNAGGL